jgi:putative ABC transport system permease protein
MIKVSFLEIISIAIEALWSNRLRTALTMLGVIIGIAAVVGITSVGQGVQKSTEQQIQSLGTNVMTVLAGASRSGSIDRGTGSASTLTWEDAKAIGEQAPAAKAISVFLQRQSQVTYSQKNVSTSVIGTDLNYPDVRNAYPQEGQFFSQEDLDTANSVVVLGSKIKDELFDRDRSPLGEEIRIQGKSYRVIGVMEVKGSAGGQDQDDRVIIPLTNMSSRLVGNNAIAGISITGFNLQSTDENELEAAQFQVTNLLRLRHNIYPPQADDFRIINQVDVLNTFTSVVSLFTVMVAIISGISLLVGGIGIANIMLVSVVERTREIGIRKAVGATKSAILQQFLAESVMVSTVGGGIGIAFGIAIAQVASSIFKFPLIVSIWSIVLGFGLSCLVGLLAGVIPARNAAKLDPIAALRSE